MNRFLIKILFATVALAAIVLAFACGSPPANTNRETNAPNTKTAVTSEENVDALADQPPSDDDICNMAYSNDKLVALTNKLEHKIDQQDSEIKKQYRGANGKDPIFKFRFYTEEINAKQYIYLVVEGKINGDKKFKKLVDFIEDFVRKTCTLRVIWVKPGTIPNDETKKMTVVDFEGFEWNACEYPNVPCAGGVCKENCDKGNTMPTETPGMSNSVNSNSNRVANR